jgi:hypothetical protein
VVMDLVVVMDLALVGDGVDDRLLAINAN